ncbi:MAG: DUF3078 domain-containing protein [Mangrovibacterium sp.]
MKFRTILLVFFTFITIHQLSALSPEERRKEVAEQDSVKNSINYLKYFLNRQGHWYPQSGELEKRVRSLVNYIEDEQIDSLLQNLTSYGQSQQRYFFRTPENVTDSLKVPGYIPQAEVAEQRRRIDRSVRNSVNKEQIAVPEQMLQNIDKKAKTLGENEASKLLGTSYAVIPDSLNNFGALPDSLLTSPDDFKRLQRLDSTKRALLEDARQKYNAAVVKQYVDSVTEAYRSEYVRQYSLRAQRQYADSIRNHNYRVLLQYNEQVMAQVNDSVARSLEILSNYVNAEQLPFLFENSDRKSVPIYLSNSQPYQIRMFVKNEQNDSLGIRMLSVGRNSVRMLIDDGVTFNRFAQRQKKDIQFEDFQRPSGLNKVDKRFKIISPWSLGADATFGFTQTYLSNWKKGGKSSLSTLTVIKGYANYSSPKTTWENSIEIRNGWLKPADDDIQKNDDKFEFITRYGVQAYRKWYYSLEMDFQTQFFNGYNYPNRETLISGFMSPAKTLFKLGMDYKPNKELSVFLSPLTLKSVYVRDTARVDQTKYGVREGRKSFWEPGLNVDLTLKKNLTGDISLQSKYKMFQNYKDPFNSFDVDWENTITMRFGNYINMQLLLHLLYDDNVTFPTSKTDADGNTIYEPKWQFKEFVTIGFTYKLNKTVYKRERIN